MKTAYIGGGNGFIGHHLARKLKSEGYWVRVVDIKEYEYGANDYADEVLIYDLRNPDSVNRTLYLDESLEFSYLPKPFTKQINFDEVYQLACNMGGAGFVFTGENDAEIMQSAKINLNICQTLKEQKFAGKVFYSSSACMYPQELQDYEKHQGLKESDAYPAHPDSEYGWEKLFSERLYLAYQRNYNLNMRIARFHNIYGPEGTYKGGREKAPAAMCRKAIECPIDHQGYFEILGDGEQTRSFLYIDDCVDAVRLLMESNYSEPVNIGSKEIVSINQLAAMALQFAGKEYITPYHVQSNALGVRGRNSDNTIIFRELKWTPKYLLREGLKRTFDWIKSQYE